MDELRGRLLRRGQIAFGALWIVCVATALGEAVFRSPDAVFLRSDIAPWIGQPIPPQMFARWLDESRPQTVVFERHFRSELPRGHATLVVRALREVALQLNGQAILLPVHDAKRWKEASAADVGPYLHAGENVLRAEVSNPKGVPMLQLRIDGPGQSVSTDNEWLVAEEGQPFAPAAIADDGRRLPPIGDLPEPRPAIRQRIWALLALAASGMTLSLILRRLARAATWAPEVALILVTLFWLWFFVAKIVRIPAGAGFDGLNHLEYIAWLLKHGTLPLANEGLQTYQPPLYHAVTACLLAVIKPTAGGAAQRAIFSLLPWLSGLGMSFVAAAMARLLLPGAAWLQAGMIVAAGLLPMNLTLAAGVSNEAPHAFLASLAVFAALRSLLAKSTTRRDDLILGALLGLALLTKYTSALLVPTLVGGVAAKRWIVDRAPPSRVAEGAAWSLALAGVLSGWFYVRNYLYFRNPFVWNQNAWPGKTLWQFPDFHTPGYFLRFGDAFTRPWYSVFYSFWDALYTTLWGDGLLSGTPTAATLASHEWWHSDWMAAGFVLALPATVFLSVGWVRAAVGAWTDKDLGRRLALSLVVLLPPCMVASIISLNLRYPLWSVGKAFFALFLTPTLAFLLVLGFDVFCRALRGRAAAGVCTLGCGWAAAFLGTIVFAYGS